MKIKTPIKILAVSLLFLPVIVFSEGNKQNNIEQIVVIRHGEKPAYGLGQLDCQGLNRSLMLPNYLIRHFPNPSYIFAPNPSVRIREWRAGNKYYDYIRPLATIEPTAIRLTLPVNTQFGYNQVNKLVNTLMQKKYHDATVYVAWEHIKIMKIAALLLKKFNSKAKVPLWKDNNYNMVFVFTINWNRRSKKLNYQVTSEGFTNISKKCPFS